MPCVGQDQISKPHVWNAFRELPHTSFTKTSGEELVETDGCSKATPHVAKGAHVSCSSELAEEDPGTQHAGKMPEFLSQMPWF